MREVAAAGLTYRAWELVYPPTGSKADRILVGVETGHGEITEHMYGVHTGISVGPGTWISVDLEGQCMESRSDLAALIFLIAQGAA